MAITGLSQLLDSSIVREKYKFMDEIGNISPNISAENLLHQINIIHELWKKKKREITLLFFLHSKIHYIHKFFNELIKISINIA